MREWIDRLELAHHPLAERREQQRDRHVEHGERERDQRRRSSSPSSPAPSSRDIAQQLLVRVDPHASASRTSTASTRSVHEKQGSRLPSVIGTSAMVALIDHRGHRLQVRVGRRAHPPAVGPVVAAGHHEVDGLAARRLDHRDADRGPGGISSLTSARTGPSGSRGQRLAHQPDRLEQLLDPHQHARPGVARLLRARDRGRHLVVGRVGVVEARVDRHARAARRRPDDAHARRAQSLVSTPTPFVRASSVVSPTIASRTATDSRSTSSSTSRIFGTTVARDVAPQAADDVHAVRLAVAGDLLGRATSPARACARSASARCRSRGCGRRSRATAGASGSARARA